MDSSEKTSREQPIGRLAEQRPPSSNPREYLKTQSRLARRALQVTARGAAADTLTVIDPRRWAASYPKATLAAGVGAGLLSGFLTSWLLTRGGVQRSRATVRSNSRGANEARRRDPSASRTVATIRFEAPEGTESERKSWRWASALRWSGKTALSFALAAARPSARAELIRQRQTATPGSENREWDSGHGALAKLWFLSKRAVAEFLKDNSFRAAAALSYYTLFSLAPLLLIATAVAGFVLNRDSVEAAVLREMEALVGVEGREFVANGLSNLQAVGRNIWATVLGVGVLLYGASAVFYQLKLALNGMWKIPPERSGGMFRVIRDRFLSFAIVLGLGFLLLVSLLVSAALSGFDEWLSESLPMPAALLQLLDGVIEFVAILVMFSMIYKWLPDVRLTWKEVGLGALVTSTLFILGKLAIGFYLGNAAISSTFGAAASVIVILLWANYSAIAFLFGAEFTYAYATLTGPGSYALRVDRAKPKTPS